MKRSRTNGCPICGRNFYAFNGHKCPPEVLRAIDAADTRIGNEDLEPTAREPLHRTEGQRISDGFEMLEDWN